MDKKQLIVLSNKVAEKMTDLFDFFGVRYFEQYDRITSVCPIHEGADNPQAFTVTTTRDQYFGYWRCWTHGCERKFVPTPIGLIRGLLTAQKGEEIAFSEAVDFALNFTSSSKEELEEEGKNFKLEKFIELSEKVYQSVSKPKYSISRNLVRESLSRPVEYYVNRGYDEKTLDVFDIGICTDQKKQMKNRIVAPVYDDDHKFMIGCVGRVPHETSNGNKWINSKHFNSGAYLYGYWLAKDRIRETRTAILVEGQGDVWRLYEAGIRNSVGMFGSSLSDGQSRILETSGALNLVVLADNDEAGEKARQSVIQKCDRLFHIVCPTFSKEDIGEMSVLEIEEEIKPQLEGMI